MTATLSHPTDASLEAKAAVAEALHVDGRFDDAASLWGALADAGYQADHPALKAAVSCYAAGRTAAGDQWLQRAERDGTPAHEVLYVAAQAAWAGGDEIRAKSLFRRIAPEDDGGRAETALGVMCWRHGRSAEAISLFRDAANRPDGGLARMNLVNASIMSGGPCPHAAGILASVAIEIPHRVEPHVLYARLLRREGDEEHSRVAFGCARLREHRITRANGAADTVVASRDDALVCESRPTAGRSRRAERALATLRELWAVDAIPSMQRPPQVGGIDAEPASTPRARRTGSILIAREVADRASDERLLRDVGRQWWSQRFSTAPKDRWVTEGLAEYGLHLADAAGVAPGYVAAARADLLIHGEGVLPSVPIAALGSDDCATAQIARVKAGWLVSMLREILAPDGLARVLRLALSAGRHTEVDAYAFAAFASYVHGNSLRWFFRQWVECAAELNICVRMPTPDAPHIAIWREGLATPGTRVQLEVSGDASGPLRPLAVDLELVANAVRVAAQPGAQVIVDPDLRWYATAEVKRDEIGPCVDLRSASSLS